jgi:hypothetical protein
MVSCGLSSISQWPLPFNSIILTFVATRFICGPRIAAQAFSPAIDKMAYSTESEPVARSPLPYRARKQSMPIPLAFVPDANKLQHRNEAIRHAPEMLQEESAQERNCALSCNTETEVEDPKCLETNGRPEWTRTIDLFRVKEAL